MKLRGWQSPAGPNSLYCLPGRGGFSCIFVCLFVSVLFICLVQGLGLRPEWTPEKPREGRGWPVQPASLLTSGSYSKRLRSPANLTPICILHNSLHGSWLAKGHLLWILEVPWVAAKLKAIGWEESQARLGEEWKEEVLRVQARKDAGQHTFVLHPELGVDSTLFLILPQ